MDREGDISRHNQALLRWLDELAVDLEPVDGQMLEEELQRTVEIALRVQAQRAESENESKRYWRHEKT
ncbi:g8085 [Coccomyxa elongata]